MTERAGVVFAPPRFADRTSLREQITDVLRGAVITGEMPAGQLFSVPTLAEKFGVSATPVREAMLDLANEGLVEPVRNKGFRVVEPTDRELDDLVALRLLLEAPTCGEIARRVGASASDTNVHDELAELRDIARQIVRHAKSGDLIAYVEADRRFHLRLLALGGNRELVDVVGRLRARSRLYGLETLAASGRLIQSAEEHVHLLDAVEAGDADGAVALMRRHIGHVRGEWAGQAEQ